MLPNTRLSAVDCLSTEADIHEMEQYPFRSAVSSLMFAIVTVRVDILYAVISVASLRPIRVSLIGLLSRAYSSISKATVVCN